MKRTAIIVAINVLVFALLLLAVEATFRVFDIQRSKYSKGIFGSSFAPYVMFINKPDWNNKPYSVFDQFQNRYEYGKRSTNNWGFPSKENFDFAAPPIDKKPDEKLVLLTGGSAAAGAGATADDRLITAVMERALNANQNSFHYRVLNFANGGWIASQEFVGLSLWGRAYNPDWVITMDGRNDIAVAFFNSHGAGYPDRYHQMASYIYGYMETGQGTSFYRGKFENLLVKYSLAYRTLTGKLLVVNNQHLMDYGNFCFVVNPISTELMGDQIGRIVQFYVNSLENITGLYNGAKYMITFQPMYYDHDRLFGLAESDVKAAAERLRASTCGPEQYGDALTVFWTHSENLIHKMITKYTEKRKIYFYNMSDVFPPKGPDRVRYFLDEVHMHDSGQEISGLFYAFKILASDFPERAAEYEDELKTELAALLNKAGQ